jgi:hypothetical protein
MNCLSKLLSGYVLITYKTDIYQLQNIEQIGLLKQIYIICLVRILIVKTNPWYRIGIFQQLVRSYLLSFY